MLGLILPLAGFWILFALSLRTEGFIQGLKNKGGKGWLLDASGLLVQGWIFPVLQAYMLIPLLRWIKPDWEGILVAPAWLMAFVSFVLVDYAYYWNHRLLHTPALWPWHRAHHSAECMDIFVSSRNSLFTHFLICYVYIHGLMIFLLADDAGYLFGIALTSALDLWRHSPHRPNWNFLGRLLILPRDHAWHHAKESAGQNFGANLTIWDRLHGTYFSAPKRPFAVGDDAPLQWKHLVLPFRD